MITASCPECASLIKFSDSPKIGQRFQCGNCSTVLVVTWLYPLSLDFIEEQGSPPPKPSETGPMDKVVKGSGG